MRIMYAAIIAALAFAGPAMAQREVAEPQPRFQRAPAPDEASTRCTLAEVAAFDSRVHVKCELFQSFRDGSSGVERRLQAYRNEFDERIVYYAVAAQSPLADRIVALAVEANPSDEVTIFFRTDAAENPSGCGVIDCRRLAGLVMPIRH